jgi:phosphate transport system substrate-binding protein
MNRSAFCLLPQTKRSASILCFVLRGCQLAVQLKSRVQQVVYGFSAVLLTFVLPLSVVSQSAQPRDHAGYVLPDGSIQIIANSHLSGIVHALDAIFSSTHPGAKFTVREGDNYSAMAALTFDRSAFAPLSTTYTRIGLGDNLKIAAEPVGFRIAHATLIPGAATPMLGIIIHRDNPVAALSMAQLTRIFAVGAPAGDVATWGQAGVTGPLSKRAIHPIGPLTSDYLDSEDPQAGEFISTDKMGGLNMNHSYVGLARYADVVQRVSEDPAAIGVTALNIPLANVKVIAIKDTDTSEPIQPTAASIASGKYPFDRYVYIYLRVGKGMPLDPFGREYVRTALSPDGQRAIAAERAGYIPLTSGEIAQELSRLDR